MFRKIKILSVADLKFSTYKSDSDVYVYVILETVYLYRLNKQ